MKSSIAGMNEGADSVLSSAIAKVKRHVLPLFVIMFIVNYIDRVNIGFVRSHICLLYTSPSPRDRQKSRMPSSA